MTGESQSMAKGQETEQVRQTYGEVQGAEGTSWGKRVAGNSALVSRAWFILSFLLYVFNEQHKQKERE